MFSIRDIRGHLWLKNEALETYSHSIVAGGFDEMS